MNNIIANPIFLMTVSYVGIIFWFSALIIYISECLISKYGDYISVSRNIIKDYDKTIRNINLIINILLAYAAIRSIYSIMMYVTRDVMLIEGSWTLTSLIIPAYFACLALRRLFITMSKIYKKEYMKYKTICKDDSI